mmetsp:Transcript_4111/g.5454  ORF Transcript_4111/g.5454 Transcript_4111/m.5454 type:complete len:203 (-) Transcript_4111:385-993(-)
MRCFGQDPVMFQCSFVEKQRCKVFRSRSFIVNVDDTNSRHGGGVHNWTRDCQRARGRHFRKPNFLTRVSDPHASCHIPSRFECFELLPRFLRVPVWQFGNPSFNGSSPSIFQRHLSAFQLSHKLHKGKDPSQTCSVMKIAVSRPGIEVFVQRTRYCHPKNLQLIRWNSVELPPNPVGTWLQGGSEKVGKKLASNSTRHLGSP